MADRIRGNCLEEPHNKQFGGLEFTFCRSLWPVQRKLSFGVEAAPDLDCCVTKALCDKIVGKANTFAAYRLCKWRTMLLLELVDFQLASIYQVGESFRQLSAKMDLSRLDYVVLVDRSARDPMECCFAWKDGDRRTEEQQCEEVQDCLNPAGNS
jgi:hypothetical protein